MFFYTNNHLERFSHQEACDRLLAFQNEFKGMRQAQIDFRVSTMKAQIAAVTKKTLEQKQQELLVEKSKGWKNINILVIGQLQQQIVHHQRIVDSGSQLNDLEDLQIFFKQHKLAPVQDFWAKESEELKSLVEKYAVKGLPFLAGEIVEGPHRGAELFSRFMTKVGDKIRIDVFTCAYIDDGNKKELDALHEQVNALKEQLHQAYKKITELNAKSNKTIVPPSIVEQTKFFSTKDERLNINFYEPYQEMFLNCESITVKRYVSKKTNLPAITLPSQFLKNTPTLVLYLYNTSKRFAIAGIDGEPIWYSNFFQMDKVDNEFELEKTMAAKAIWWATQLMMQDEYDEINLLLRVSISPAFAYHLNNSESYHNMPVFYRNLANDCAVKHGIQLWVEVIDDNENPAMELTQKTDYMSSKQRIFPRPHGRFYLLD